MQGGADLFFFPSALSSPKKSHAPTCRVHLHYYSCVPRAGRILTVLQGCYTYARIFPFHVGMLLFIFSSYWKIREIREAVLINA